MKFGAMTNFFIVFGLIYCVSARTDYWDAKVDHQCNQRCPLQNRTDDGHYKIDCDYQCKIKQCANGCKLWKTALNESCNSVCNGTLEKLDQKELYCLMGCNEAMSIYFSQLKARLGIPPAPALVADSLTATSLSLEWNFPEGRLAGLTYYVQFRYEEEAAQWQYCRNQSWGPQDTVLVDNLLPYTKYRFRVALVLANHEELIESAESVVISTLPSGVPASPPTIVRAVAIDSTRISVNWEPGKFPHGPLLSYVLRISENHPNGSSALKDVPATTKYYTFQNLMPSTTYRITVTMTNGEGAGPSTQTLVTTPPEQLAKNAEKPVLILATYHDVIKQEIEKDSDSVKLYTTQSNIKGIALHIARNLMFVSDSAGEIHRMSLDDQHGQSRKTILNTTQLNFLPLDLSVDWLNDQLYILGEVPIQRTVWQITRCNLDGQGRTVAIAGLNSKPLHIEVDPYNGYLFWTSRDFNKVSLYRLDLSDISNGIKHNVKPALILQEPSLGAFTIDYSSYHLVVSNQEENTLLSVSFDGTEVINLRPHHDRSSMQKVLSLATANKNLYWTDGTELYWEKYHEDLKIHFLNTYVDLNDSEPYIKVLVNLPSSQPVPLPVNPPTLVQTIFGSNFAQASWHAPHLLGFQGKGAWQNWSYKLEVKDILETYNATYYTTTTSYTITNLEPNTEYIIKAKATAYTHSEGPWSSEFKGMTLKLPTDEKYPLILWSAAEGLLKSDTTGQNVENIIHRSLMKNFHFTNMAWYDDQLYLVTNTSQVFWFNLLTHEYDQLSEIENVGSIAVDWLGKKLYWSNPKQQLIIRSTLNGTQQEPLPILTLAKELIIDAVKAYLYWSTGYTVECAHLNGADKSVYHAAQLFSGKQVMGLTLDMERHLVYWIVRGSEGSTLFKATMAGYAPTDDRKIVSQIEMFSNLQKPNMQGPLCYFDNRLLWLQDDKSAAISDFEGKNIAKISGKSMSSLTMVYIVDSNLHALPKMSTSLESLSVIPEMVDGDSVRVIGSWKSFNVTWVPIQNVNFGTVFYEININSFSKNESTVITTAPSVTYWQRVAPFTELLVTLRAFTYWGSSPYIQTKVYSPASTPSAPYNLRTYVTFMEHHHLSKNVDVTFRWDSPKHSNGVVQGYIVFCWYIEDGERIDICEDARVIPTAREYTLYQMEQNETYYFEVQAYTVVGKGEISDTASVDTSIESPLPRLLIASKDSIFIRDIDTKQNYSLLHGISTPVEIGYLMKEEKVFWINDMRELLMFNNKSNKYTKIFDTEGDAVSLTVDWLERSIYYTQTENNIPGTSVYKIDLNHMDEGIIKSTEIFSTGTKIYEIEISPFTRKLYWTEAHPYGGYVLMQSETDGTNIEPFFYNHFHTKRHLDENNIDCNCPYNRLVEKIFTVDHSNSTAKPLLIFIDSATYDLIATDKNGCRCEVIAENSVIGESLPMETLKSDFGTLYWTNMTKGLLYSLKKAENDVKVEEQINAKDLLIFGSHMQPYPPNECLIPIQCKNLTLTLLSKASTSLTFSMPKITLHSDCTNVSIATVQYIIYYKENLENQGYKCDENCMNITTFNTTLLVESLKPFSNYTFFVAISNYYLDVNGFEAYIGPPITFQTAAGTPSPPQSVSVVVLNPTLAEVSWLPSKEFNGPSVRYEIHWKTNGTISGIKHKGEQAVPTESGDNFNANLQKLTPYESYLVWVRAYSVENDSYSDSEGVEIQTFPEPDEMMLHSRTAYSVKINWKNPVFVESYKIQYCSVISSEWIDVNESSVINYEEYVSFEASNLKPKMQYKFRTILKYPLFTEPYIWPSDTRFIFETDGDRPSPPGVPIIQHKKGDEYQIWWEKSRDNGAAIEFYMLQTLKYPVYRTKRSTNRTAWYHNSPEVEEPENEWESIYNGTKTSWTIEGLSDKYKYAFRALAYNSYGWSDPSNESMEFDITEAAQLAEKQDPTNLILTAICVPVLFCFIVVICFVCCKWRCAKDQKAKEIITCPRGRPDVELATLRELPRQGNFIHNTNVLYVSDQSTTDEITVLPHIRRDQITLMKFLGSGAFGEVFEGKARGLENGEIKVAVKTLRKGASEQEKNDFLKEAQLMSQFKHEHILQLLGVCLDNDPHFIIMELMQGGDLLTYLRSSRNLASNMCALSLLDLLKMCVDVANGCRYLEETHFVHRDLACRNCLVSSTNPSERIVKIGDFGLARDIYKNDYYRKEGEGLLPVRWMSPESLVYGVFTSQSDVWAFGVLLWEIMTLGQQPYPAISNVEILKYLREGERLGKPTDCPEGLHALMLICWDSEPEKRPTFKYCLEVLEDLHIQATRNPITAAHEGQYISTVPDEIHAVSNEAYFRDENHNNSGTSWKSGSETDSTPFLSPHTKNCENETPKEIPKYLELLYDGDCENEGYEIPRKSPMNEKQDMNKNKTENSEPSSLSTISTTSENTVKCDTNINNICDSERTIKDVTRFENLLKEDNNFIEKRETV